MKREIALVAALLLAACQGASNEQQGSAIGAGGGALIGALAGKVFGKSTGATVAGAAIGAIGGYFIGSSIGAKLDAAAREKAERATHQALVTPVKYKEGKPVRPPPRHWRDQGSDTHGHSDVIKVDPQSDGGECRTVREVAYIKGEEVVQKSRYCRAASGEWEPKST